MKKDERRPCPLHAKKCCLKDGAEAFVIFNDTNDNVEDIDDIAPSELSPTLPRCTECPRPCESSPTRKTFSLRRNSRLCKFCDEVKEFVVSNNLDPNDFLTAVNGVTKWRKNPIRKSLKDSLEDKRKYLFEAWKYRMINQMKATDSAEKPSERHLTVIYNPVSGSGRAKKIVDDIVKPMLSVGGVQFKSIATQRRGHAVEVMMALNPLETDGVLIAGGDGLVHEVVTGLMRRTDADIVTKKLGVGIIPAGSANAMAHELDRYSSRTDSGLIAKAVLCAIKGLHRPIDVIEMNLSEEKPLYALSVFGWGLAGTVAKAADQLRWIPGQKKFRYDIAGLVSFVKDWPIKCFAELEYLLPDGSWTKQDLQFTNLTASNLPVLGADHPIHPDLSPDDGELCLTWIDNSVSRRTVAKLGMAMKHGKHLALQKASKSVLTSEFKLRPKANSTVAYLVDGDPVSPTDVHVKLLRHGLRLFAVPLRRTSDV